MFVAYLYVSQVSRSKNLLQVVDFLIFFYGHKWLIGLRVARESYSSNSFSYVIFVCFYEQISVIMADDFDIEAMLEAPYKKVGILFSSINLHLNETAVQSTLCFR